MLAPVASPLSKQHINRAVLQKGTTLLDACNGKQAGNQANVKGPVFLRSTQICGRTLWKVGPPKRAGFFQRNLLPECRCKGTPMMEGRTFPRLGLIRVRCERKPIILCILYIYICKWVCFLSRPACSGGSPSKGQHVFVYVPCSMTQEGITSFHTFSHGLPCSAFMYLFG